MGQAMSRLKYVLKSLLPGIHAIMILALLTILLFSHLGKLTVNYKTIPLWSMLMGVSFFSFLTGYLMHSFISGMKRLHLKADEIARQELVHYIASTTGRPIDPKHLKPHVRAKGSQPPPAPEWAKGVNVPNANG